MRFYIDWDLEDIISLSQNVTVTSCTIQQSGNTSKSSRKHMQVDLLDQPVKVAYSYIWKSIPYTVYP